MINFNMLKAWPAWTRGALQLLELGACGARVDRARGTFIHAERERKKGKSCDTWHVLIDCLDFYLLNNLDSIISMQIIFFLFTKIHDFFSL